MKLNYAKVGTVIHGTHLASDLIPAYTDTLEGLIVLNGHYLALPENRAMRDRVNNAMGEGQDWCDGIADGDVLLNETLPDALSEFAPPYCYFGTSEGDGSDFGFWPNREAIEELPNEPEKGDREGEGEGDYKTVNGPKITVYNCYGMVLLELV